MQRVCVKCDLLNDAVSRRSMPSLILAPAPIAIIRPVPLPVPILISAIVATAIPTALRPRGLGDDLFPLLGRDEFGLQKIRRRDHHRQHILTVALPGPTGSRPVTRYELGNAASVRVHHR